MTQWTEDDLTILPKEVLSLECSKCTISDDRAVGFPSYPILRHKRIMIVSEFPGYESIKGDISPNFMKGHTWNILERVFFYLNLKPWHFSYTPLIRCWRNLTHTVTDQETNTCRDYIKMFATLTESPLIVTLGSSVCRSMFRDEDIYEGGKFLNIDILRRKWDSEPFPTILGIPGVMTEHPMAIKLGRCNSQLFFRNLCVDFMRAVGIAANLEPEYANIAKTMSANYYMEDYNTLLKEVEVLKQGMKL